MLRNFLKSVIWTFRRNKSYGVLNMVGLAVGIAAALLIFLWVEDELTYNHVFKNRDRLYKVMQSETNAGKTNVFSSTPSALAEMIREQIPEAMNTVRLTFPQKVVMSLDTDDKRTYETGYFCDPSFFSMFSVQFVNGSPESAFRDPSSIVLSEKTAEKFFPEGNPVGKILKINMGRDRRHLYTVTAVVKEFPENVTLRFDWVIPYQALLDQSLFGTARFVNTFIELNPSADVQAVNGKLAGMVSAQRDSGQFGAFLFNMNDWHLYSDFDDQGKPVGNKVGLIRLFVFIACVIIVLACINFMNLATAGAMKRANEVGVWKAVGLRRTTLVRRFLGESMALAFVSLALSIVIVLCIMPVFNQLTSKNLSFNIFTPAHIVTLIALLLFCGLLSGAYPAFFLSSFKAIDVLKGLKIPGRKGVDNMRKTLVVFQLCVSVCLMVCIVTMYTQSRHTRNRDWGFRKEGVVTIPINRTILDYSVSLLQKIKGMPTVENAGIAMDILNSGYNTGIGNFNWKGKDAEMELQISIVDCITGVLATMGIELEAGRDFGEFTDAEQGNIIINRRLAQLMGEEGTLGSEIKFQEKNYRIIGITKDHFYDNYHALHSKPLAIFCGLNRDLDFSLYVKCSDRKNISSTLQPIEALLKPYITDRPFEYSVLEDNMNRMMRNELFVANLLTGFTVIAILISCFGLLGLIAFAAEQRTKEIGIRKVLGATVSQMVLLLSKDFLKLTGIASAIAFLIAWWVMNRWLDNYEYRIGLYWWIFALAGVTAVAIAMCTVGFQAIRAATANPVKAIKME